MAEFGGRGAGTEAVVGVRTETTVDHRRTAEILPRAPARVSNPTITSHRELDHSLLQVSTVAFRTPTLLRTAVETVQKKKKCITECFARPAGSPAIP